MAMTALERKQEERKRNKMTEEQRLEGCCPGASRLTCFTTPTPH
jgi:predicted transposase YdaD